MTEAEAGFLQDAIQKTDGANWGVAGPYPTPGLGAYYLICTRRVGVVKHIVTSMTDWLLTRELADTLEWNITERITRP